MSTLNQYRQSAIINTLRNCKLFSGLPAADIQKIANLVVVKQLAKDDYLFHEGEPSVGFFVVQSGSINLHRLSAMGKEQVIHIFREGDSFAEATLASGTGYPVDARAIEPSQVLLVQKNEFIALLRLQPELVLRMFASMSQHLRVLVGLLDDLKLKDVETRLANWLVKRCPQPLGDAPQTISLKMTKRMLAAEIGTVSETLSRTLAKLREQQMIDVKGRDIIITCPSKLAGLLQRNLGG